MARAHPDMTLGNGLERQRLEHRIAHIRKVLGALEDRAELSSHGGTVPPALTEAIRDFSAELSRMNRRHAELSRRR